MTDKHRALERLGTAAHGGGVALTARLTAARRSTLVYAWVLAGLLPVLGPMGAEHAAAGSAPNASSQVTGSVSPAAVSSSSQAHDHEPLLTRDGWQQSCALSACAGNLSAPAAELIQFRARCADEHGAVITYPLDRTYFTGERCLHGFWSFQGYHRRARATCSWEGFDGSTWTTLAHIDFAADVGSQGRDSVVTYFDGDVPIGVRLSLRNRYVPRDPIPVTLEVTDESGKLYRYQATLDRTDAAEAEFPRDFNAPTGPGRYTWSASAGEVAVTKGSFQLTARGSHAVGAQCFDAITWFPSTETSLSAANAKDLGGTPARPTRWSQAALESELSAKLERHFREQEDDERFEQKVQAEALAGAYSVEEYSKLVAERWKKHLPLWSEEIPALTQSYRETFGIEGLRAFCRRSRPALLRRFAPETVKQLPKLLSDRNDDAWRAREFQRVVRGGADRVGCDSID